MFVFCKIDVFLLTSLLNRTLLVIIGSVGRWSVSMWSVVHRSVGGGAVTGGFNKTVA